MFGSRKLLCLLLFGIFAASSATAASYYVTQSGAGLQTGTSLSNAWSVSKYNASAAPTGGDTVFFSGTITSTIVPGSSGTSNGAGRLTLDLTGATITSSIVKLNFGARNFITILGGTISSDAGGHDLFWCSSAAHDVTISGFTFTGQPANYGTDTFVEIVRGCNNITVSGNYADNIESFIVADGGPVSNINIANNYARSSANTVDQTDLIFLPDSNTVVIEGNKLINQAPGDPVNRHNDVIQTFKSGASGSVNPTNWTIRYNWIEAAQQGGNGNISWHELENLAGQPALKIYSNVYVGTGSSQNGGNGISLHSGTNSGDTYYFYNNTQYVHQMPLNPLRLGEGDGPGTVFYRNNIGMADSGGCGDCPQVTFTPGTQANRNYMYHWDTCTSTLSGTNGSCSTNPLFVDTTGNNFALQSASTLIGAGDSTIGPEYNLGIAPDATWPNPRLVTRTSTSWDVGAYQASAGNPSPPTNVTATPH